MDPTHQNARPGAPHELGVQVPADITVDVLEETASQVYLVLPAAPPQSTKELADSELEAVAGGWSGPSDCGTCVGANTCQWRASCPGPG